MGVNSVDYEMKRAEALDRIEKFEVCLSPIYDNTISNYQEYHKLSGYNIDMCLKRLQDIKDLFYRVKKKILEYCGSDPNLEDLLYLGIQECAKRISGEFEESKTYLEKAKKQGGII